MTSLLIYPLPGNDTFALKLSLALSAELGELETRTFPDSESYVRLQTPPKDRDVILVCTLSKPDAKFLRLAFVAAAAKDLGARSVGLVAPYLAYMRQDIRFRDGEAISSVTFARLLSSVVDWLVTVDPHLHRRASLSEIYSIPTFLVHAGPVLADWIKAHVPHPVIVGPDSESRQWVAEVAERVDAPYRVLSKSRSGDRSVSISLPDLIAEEALSLLPQRYHWIAKEDHYQKYLKCTEAGCFFNLEDIDYEDVIQEGHEDDDPLNPMAYLFLMSKLRLWQ